MVRDGASAPPHHEDQVPSVREPAAAQPPQPKISANASRQRKAQRDGRAEAQGGQMHHRDTGTEPDQAPEAVGKHRRGRRSADAGMQDQHHADEYERDQRDDPADGRSDPARQCDDTGHQRRHHRGAQRDIVPAPRDQRHLDMTEAPHQRQAYRERNGVGGDGAGKRQMNQPQQRYDGDPHRECGAEADQHAMALRQHDIGQAEKDRRGVDRQARHRAFGDERRIVIEREEDIRRACRDRQCGDQRADHRTGAFGDDGRRNHEHSRDGHAQCEGEEEGEVGRHSVGRHPEVRALARLEGRPQAPVHASILRDAAQGARLLRMTAILTPSAFPPTPWARS